MNTAEAPATVQHVVTVLAATLAVVSILSLAFVLVQYMAGATPFTALVAVGLYGLPVAFLLLIALLLLRIRTRRHS
ncbi:hypothetical protein [Arthrobacter sp. JSM 101049]|uniref:hypothetical protein n=1 Tax=Arthrobacter sp. JSM 101049 TaxID=929097 RepID=UPI0035678A72